MVTEEPAEAREPDLHNPDCPTRLVLDRIGDRWTVLVVLLLSRQSPMRFTELRRGVGGIAPKVLTQTLRALERDGLIKRTVYAEVPPRVEYELTALGASLRTPITAIGRWAERHVSEVLDARANYDGDQSGDQVDA
ncbi:winged helix-turn-helix transcriptional regulator [Streptoalloteichus hindustanus]|uniref:Transcriptional regulator, HxlR family n=1 Tax=Streptoalloteichus hindustanus TaxID=2017 RepID=A0A1M5KVD4_STRHI|nr:helix-turn-helix domain-containing protein [Streptoalloteichus hindustanus]SHG56686.1 transcriptional regulator, HxlR family [Streptoalloteichus hindustanus]